MAKERKKSEPKPIDVDAEVTKALLMIATAEKPMRLIKRGAGHDAVFASDKTEKAKKVVEKCLEDGKELVAVIDEGTTQERTELTPAGRSLVAAEIELKGSKLPPEERLTYFTDEAQRKLIPAARYEEVLGALTAELAKADAAKAEANRRIREAREEDERKLQAALRVIAERKTAEVAFHTRELAALGVVVGSRPHIVDTVEPVLPKLPMPTNDEEKDFRRQYARRLVSAWYQAVAQGNKDGQRFLEDALYNMDGLHVIGEVGSQVTFDPVMHEPSHGAEVGARITITRCGWWLEEPQGRYILLRASAE